MTTQAYQRLTPCVDAAGHRFTVDRPTPGTWGHAFTFCERCGATRAELQLPASIARAVVDAISPK